MHCLISVIMNHWPEYDAQARILKQQIVQHPDPLGFAPPPIFGQASGFLLVVDWDNERILAGRPFPKPFGFVLRDEMLYVATWDGEDVLAVCGNTVIRRFKHPWFNHLHSIDPTPDGFLITSSGTDLIAEVDCTGELLWEFFLFEHGYGQAPYPLAGLFQRSQNYNHRYIPSYISKHVNSAIRIDDETILATVFRSNELIHINRRTKKIETVLSGLHRPHSIRRRHGGGYVLSDTEGRAVILLDSCLRPERAIPVYAPWIQDAVPAGDRLLVVSNIHLTNGSASMDGTGASPLTGVVEFTMDGGFVKRLDLGAQHRLYMVEPITPEQADSLTQAWDKNNIDTGAARWVSGPAR
jgi:hypothetical protein